MRQFIDVTGKTEEEAINRALEQLKLDRDDVSVEILERAKAMGIPYHVDPFTSLSFLALPVIPELRLTDRGLFDVTAFSLVKD